MEDNNRAWAKRTEGKVKQGMKKYAFYSYYRKNTINSKMTRLQFDAFMNDMIESLTKAMINESLDIKIPLLGVFRVRERKLTLLNDNGEVKKSLKADWGKSWDFWRTKYPELTDNEIAKLKGKQVLYHDNEHTNNCFYSIVWEKRRSVVRNKSIYVFKPMGTLKQKLVNVLKDNDKQIFYYG
jgi:hypothetical protein